MQFFLAIIRFRSFPLRASHCGRRRCRTGHETCCAATAAATTTVGSPRCDGPARTPGHSGSNARRRRRRRRQYDPRTTGAIQKRQRLAQQADQTMFLNIHYSSLNNTGGQSSAMPNLNAYLQSQAGEAITGFAVPENVSLQNINISEGKFSHLT